MRIRDITFTQLAPEVYLDRRPIVPGYGRDYFDEFERRANTEVGQLLHAHRLQWVRSYVPTGTVCDYGCGYGVNVISQPDWVGWDINPFCQDRLEKHGKLDHRYDEYPAVCLFDVFEHLPEPTGWLVRIRKGTKLFITMPCWNDWANLHKLPKWKHWKPGEHLLYASMQGLTDMICSYGFKLLERGDLEGRFGREDIGSFVFSKS